MKYSRVRQVRQPIRGTALSAGIDFFVPQIIKNFRTPDEEFIKEFDPQFLIDLKQKNQSLHQSLKKKISNQAIILEPQDSVLIPSGIHVNLNEVIEGPMLYDDGPAYRENTFLFGAPVGVMLVAHNKSGVGTKKNLDRLAEVVDQDYQGEMHISVINVGNKTQNIYPGDKLIQFILEPVLLNMPSEVDFDELYPDKSERGEGGFGSTGN